VRVDAFDFALPEDLIALRPVSPRHSARLLVVGPDGALAHRHVADLPQLLSPGDSLVLNDSRVIRARLRAVRAPRAAGLPQVKAEIMLHRRLGADRFLAFARPARRLKLGDDLSFGTGLMGRIVACGERGEVEVRFSHAGAALDAGIASLGEIPLPPYIAGKRDTDARDESDYQTVFAREPGSVAAPTAGLHFTPVLMEELRQSGVTIEYLTLHVGAGTFLPVSSEDTTGHRMHAEHAVLDAEAANRLNAGVAKGGRLIAVGTTALRTLETASGPDSRLQAFNGDTDVFITPGYRFRRVDALVTNFHLPRSTLFMLVSAFCGLEVMQHAYAAAIAARYRFYSYGDACLLWRAS
jgi:S-adenosylmethionine:tRNA ribosyltransferase-isomerase